MAARRQDCNLGLCVTQVFWCLQLFLEAMRGSELTVRIAVTEIVLAVVFDRSLTTGEFESLEST